MFHADIFKHYRSFDHIPLMEDYNYGTSVDFDIYWSTSDSVLYLVEYPNESIILREFALLKLLTSKNTESGLFLKYAGLEKASQLHTVLTFEIPKNDPKRFSYSLGDNIYYYTLSNK